MTIVITGATGAIGIYAAKQALKSGCKVIAIIRKQSRAKLADLPVEIIECDADNYSEYKPKIQADAFIHLAWEGVTVAHRDDTYLQLRNIKNTLGAVELAANLGCKTFVFATSQAEVGNLAAGKLCGEQLCEPLGENTPCNPTSAYGAAKLAVKRLGQIHAEKLGLCFTSARILSVFSPMADDNSLVNYVVRTLLNGDVPALTRCEQIWDLLSAETCGDMLTRIAEKGRHAKTYTLGTDSPRLLKSYIEEIRDIINPELKLGFGEKDYYPHQPMCLCADISALEEDIGKFHSNFKNGIMEVIDYYAGRK